MQRYILRRLISTISTLIGVSLLVFLLLRMVPGTVIDIILGLRVERTPELIKEMREFFGLDVPLHVQYFRWVKDILSGRLGTSWRGGMPVIELIRERFPVTLELTLLAMLITVCVGIPAGIVSAVYRDTLLDNLGRLVSFAGLGLPEFWVASIMILIVSRVFHWMPPMRYARLFDDPAANLRMVVLPAIALGTVNVANVMRLTRSAMLEVLSADYIRTARAKGLKERQVILRHALRNCLIPIVTVTALMTGYLLGGAVTVEAVFVLPGLGRLLFVSILERNYPAVQGVLLFTCSLFVLINFFVDLLYAYINPKIRYT